MDILSPRFLARFRTREGAENFVAAYNTSMQLWTVPYEIVGIEGSFGTTHVKVCGASDAPPLVLIHGGQISSPVWYPNVELLSQHFRVYTPDVIDQMGMSIPTRKLKTEQDCSDWLTEVLDGLGLNRVILGGHSHGGWQALNMALRYPQRVEKLVLLSPAASFARLAMQVLLRMLPVFVRPTRNNFYRPFRWMSTLPLDVNDPNPLIEQFMIGALAFKPDELSLGVVRKFKDDELRQMTIPTLLLIGSDEVTYSAKPQKVMERALELLPNIEGAFIPNSKHLFPITQADKTNRRILAFLLGADS